MLRTVAIALLVCACTFARAQERVPREQCLKAACQLSLDLKQLLDTPIPTDPDIKRAVAVARDEHAALVLPETKLSADTLAKAGKEPVSVGQLWLHKVLPLRDGQPVKVEELRMLNVGPADNQRTVAQCVLAVQKNADGKLELVILGKEKKPMLALPLKETATAPAGDDPIDISAVGQNDTGVVTLKIVGKYEATFEVGRAD
ncbi:MAG: hypothetical protein ACHRHE_03825 [Tepidisphaerales bacterium]